VRKTTRATITTCATRATTKEFIACATFATITAGTTASHETIVKVDTPEDEVRNAFGKVNRF
jgi:hypothetical protein